MGKFKDYETAWDSAKRSRKHLMRKFGRKAVAEVEGNYCADINDLKEVYTAEMREAAKRKDAAGTMRFIAEHHWYLNKRPYFNVYPIIERKLKELSPNLSMDKLTIPFQVMEIRTYSETYFAADFGDKFHIVINTEDSNRFREVTIAKHQTIESSYSSDTAYLDRQGNPRERTDEDSYSEHKVKESIFLICGLCMLVNDKSIVQPVVLAESRRDFMTLAELERFKDKAIRRTGKTGFDVGRDLQSPKATAHYRNGCFARYWVADGHEQYPAGCTEKLSPIIKWRSGAVVNADAGPSVPTGFKDLGKLVQHERD